MSQPSKEAFLGTLEIFAELDEEELADLARIAEEYEFADQAVLAYQRDVADKFIIVRSGRLYAYRVDNQGVVRDSRSYLPGDYFDDSWLFVSLSHPATVRGAGEGRVLFIEQADFLQFLKRHPEAFEYLNLSEEAQQAAEGSLFAQPRRRVSTLSLLPNEIIEFYSRRSIYLLPLNLFLPVAGLIVAVVLVQLLIGYGSTLSFVCTGLALLLLGLYALVKVMDWYNDYFVITNKHVIHREFQLLRYRIDIVKIPVDQVQSVEIERPGLLATILNTGTAQVTTSAQASVVRFDYMDNPEEVKEVLNRLMEQSEAMDAGRIQAIMRESLEEQFEAAPAYSKVEEEIMSEDGEEAASPVIPSIGFLERIRRNVGGRVVTGNVITYRKHVFTLLGSTWLQMLIGLILLVAMIFVTSLTFALILLVLWLLNFAWLVWRFEDWRNDIYQVSDRFVIDIDRRPFGFGESRKQAELSNIQNVSTERPGFLATIFNFGNVAVDTAGASADITFEKIANPRRAQSDIFRLREELLQRQRLMEGHHRRQEFAVMLDVYQQAQEQNRLPRRTPPENP